MFSGITRAISKANFYSTLSKSQFHSARILPNVINKNGSGEGSDFEQKVLDKAFSSGNQLSKQGQNQATSTKVGGTIPFTQNFNTNRATLSSQSSSSFSSRRMEAVAPQATLDSKLAKDENRRVVNVIGQNVVGGYRRLQGLLRQNNVRQMLRMRQRYEKPYQKRQRKAKMANSYRVKQEVDNKVKLVMKMHKW
ncbi:hypothetical protein AX774_g2805 [Zancudomyces culisetae]|uniref:37S ribosomal protein mrp21, mitochondrial n=1 Tax=Zancudomyces culisetae TaxID=1213189 RepID=A0A1R1PRU5_ZANCU|nr:hypothetical protein AX774_g2805 [Zancudomyces culisetae]|eukprot:OMH83687.1 hypothetical protein AX774_g2805 [Zancudomyces culisetae]